MSNRHLWYFMVAYAIVIIVLMFTMGNAKAHKAPSGWEYPIQCCSLRDCRETAEGEVIENNEGYLLVSTGEFIKHGDRRIKEIAPDGKIHVCQQGGNFDSGRVLCLITPPKSF